MASAKGTVAGTVETTAGAPMASRSLNHQDLGVAGGLLGLRIGGGRGYRRGHRGLLRGGGCTVRGGLSGAAG